MAKIALKKNDIVIVRCGKDKGKTGKVLKLFPETNRVIVERINFRKHFVKADRTRLKQVLINLLSNAVKFVEPGRGRVEVALSEDGEFLRVDVRDNGKGISLEDQAIIFDKFRQAGDTLTGKPQGSGLGLHISRRIIEHFGGRMWVASRPGEGACFSFTLPRMREFEFARAA